MRSSPARPRFRQPALGHHLRRFLAQPHLGLDVCGHGHGIDHDGFWSCHDDHRRGLFGSHGHCRGFHDPHERQSGLNLTSPRRWTQSETRFCLLSFCSLTSLAHQTWSRLTDPQVQNRLVFWRCGALELPLPQKLNRSLVLFLLGLLQMHLRPGGCDAPACLAGFHPCGDYSFLCGDLPIWNLWGKTQWRAVSCLILTAL